MNISRLGQWIFLMVNRNLNIMNIYQMLSIKASIHFWLLLYIASNYGKPHIFNRFLYILLFTLVSIRLGYRDKFLCHVFVLVILNIIILQIDQSIKFNHNKVLSKHKTYIFGLSELLMYVHINMLDSPTIYVLCLESTLLWLNFVDWSIRKVIMFSRDFIWSGSLARKHDTEICLDNPIKIKVNSSIKRKQLNMWGFEN